MAKNRKVLIIDDDIIIRSQLERELRRNFFETTCIDRGLLGLEIFRQDIFDIVLLDVMLPDSNGLELLLDIKKIRSDTEIIVITGYGSQEVAIESLRNGAIDYIEKPVQGEALYAALGRAQEKLREREELSYQNTILLIDDDPSVIKFLSRFLEKENFEVFTALDGREGIKIIEEKKIDVIVTDIKMREISGIEVLQMAKKKFKDIEGIVVTGQKAEELAIQALRAGALGYITKPINLDELLISVNKAIERINLHRDRLYRHRELKITSEIITKMNEELERRIEERSRELTQMQMQLFQTSKLATLGEMSAGLAHEINQPLSGIALTTATLKKLLQRNKLQPEDLLSGIMDIEKCTKRMANTIQHIRTFARQDTLKFVEVQINETLVAAMTMLREQLRLHEIDLIFNPEENLPKVIGEPYQLEQVWINLIANARHALEDREKILEKNNYYRKQLIITSKFRETEQIVQVSMRDNGLGIKEEDLSRIFEPFFTTKEVGQATGLGLSISYGIINAHKGRIVIESEYGQGTQATVEIPAKKMSYGDNHG